MKTILIADSHALCREALCNYLRHADIEANIQGAGDYDSLCDLIKSGHPDVILVDRDLSGLMRQDFKVRMPSGARLGWMYSDLFEQPQEYGQDDTDEENWGLFSKNLSCKDFLEGIEGILAGNRFEPKQIEKTYNSSVTSRLAERFATVRDFNLTNREKQVLEYLVKGASNKDIARALSLQVVTVKLHVRGICRKMEVTNRTQAALTAKENGWG